MPPLKNGGIWTKYFLLSLSIPEEKERLYQNFSKSFNNLKEKTAVKYIRNTQRG